MFWVAYPVGFGFLINSDTSGNVRKTGGNFKEKFREHGGLDAVFDVTRHCHSNVEVRACMFVCLVICVTKSEDSELKWVI